MPVATNLIVRTVKPSTTNIPRGTLVKHRELVSSSLIGPSVFAQIDRLRINPGSRRCFPWLSSVAVGFEKFRFRKLHLLYVPRTATSTSGNLVFSPDYDAADGAGTTQTEQQMVANIDAVETTVYKEARIIIQPTRLNETYKAHYIMSDGRFSGTTQDAKTIDPGQVFIGGEASTGIVLGKLFWEYEVELLNPCNPTEHEGGGAGLTQTVTGTTNPVITSILVNNQEVLPIMVASGGGSNVATFTSDWSGLINTFLTGTGISTTPAYDLVRNINGVPNSLVQTVKNSVINATGTNASFSSAINALSGDVLHWRPGVGLSSGWLTAAQNFGETGVFT